MCGAPNHTLRACYGAEGKLRGGLTSSGPGWNLD